MERSRSKRSYYYDQDYDSQTLSRTKPRYHNNHHYGHRRGNAGRSSAPQDQPSSPVSIVYRILCPDVKAGGVIGKSGSIIKAFRQETGAWINVHSLVHGDEERIIEISDSRRRDPDGRAPPYSPAQEALLMIHERIIECDGGLEVGFEGGGDEDDEYGPRGSGGPRVVTRLIVPRSIVGCLLGKGGKIIEQMRIETKTRIRILPRDHSLPRCVSMSEEIVQVVGDGNAVKKAVTIISSRLKDAMLRDHGPFRGRLHSPDLYFPADDEFGPPLNNIRSPLDLPASGPRLSRSKSYASHSSGYGYDSATTPMGNHAQSFFKEDIVFQILCPNDKVESITGDSDGILEILQGDIGVDVRVSDPVPGSDERIIIVSSDEGPDDELFPAQEALLHIQSYIVDLGPDKDNIITTRLLVSTDEVTCLNGISGTLSEMGRLTRANIQILPRDEIPQCASGGDELVQRVVQIVGDIAAAREAVCVITSRLRSHLFREITSPRDSIPPSVSGPSHPGSGIGGEDSTSPYQNSAREGYQGNEPPPASYQNIPTATATRPLKDTGRSGSGLVEPKENNTDEGPSVPNRFHAPIVTKSTLEVIIPEHAVPSLMMRSGSKLAQISEMSGATVSFIEDRPDRPEKIIQISGTPDQAERAQSLLQGFILSTQDDLPSS